MQDYLYDCSFLSLCAGTKVLIVYVILWGTISHVTSTQSILFHKVFFVQFYEKLIHFLISAKPNTKATPKMNLDIFCITKSITQLKMLVYVYILNKNNILKYRYLYFSFQSLFGILVMGRNEHQSQFFRLTYNNFFQRHAETHTNNFKQCLRPIEQTKMKKILT